jgi:purine nucleosidase/pyrimidine-specific ribonucleoside hydrolase
VVIATGPLTNIALLLRIHPEVRTKIKEIAWMGGSTGRGNVTPYAEFNCWVDPEAAAVVVAAGLRFSMVGLNVTHLALVTPEVLDQLAAVGNATSAFAVELLKFFRASYQEAEGMAAPPLHDPVAVALVAVPEIVTTVHTRLDIELHGPETVGATSVDLHNKLGRPANAHVAVDLDADRFWKTVEDAIRRMR